MAKGKEAKKHTLGDTIAELESRIAGLKVKAREKKGAAAGDPALRALKKRLRRAQRRRRSLQGFMKTLEARRAGKKIAPPPPPAAPAP